MVLNRKGEDNMIALYLGALLIGGSFVGHRVWARHFNKGCVYRPVWERIIQSLEENPDAWEFRSTPHLESVTAVNNQTGDSVSVDPDQVSLVNAEVNRDLRPNTYWCIQVTKAVRTAQAHSVVRDIDRGDEQFVMEWIREHRPDIEFEERG